MAITINGSGTITGVSAGGLPDGCVTADDIASLPSGSVLQVVEGSSSSWATSTSDASYTSASISTNITPSSTSSKILAIAHMNGVYKSSGSSSTCLDMQIFRGSTGLGDFAATVWETSTSLQMVGSAVFSKLDSPSTTSQITYDVRFRSRNNTSTVGVNYAGVSTSKLILMEIAG